MHIAFLFMIFLFYKPQGERYCLFFFVGVLLSGHIKKLLFCMFIYVCNYVRGKVKSVKISGELVLSPA